MTAWSCDSSVKVILGILQKFCRRGYASSIYLFHEKKERLCVLVQVVFVGGERLGWAPNGNRPERIKSATYFASFREEILWESEHVTASTLIFLPCRLLFQRRQALCTRFVYSCNSQPSGLTGSLYWQSVTRGGTGCAIILSSNRSRFLSREHCFGQ